jgi:hypothetical protein
MMPSPFRYLVNLLVGADEVGNAVLAGSPRHTISARTGYALHRGKTWAKLAAPVINTLMGSPDHCADAARSEGLIKPDVQPDDPPY